MSTRTLYLFPHQDDEYFISPRISRDIADGLEPHCVFVTNGSATLSKVRDSESSKALRLLGVKESCIHFFGSQESIPDSKLVERLAPVLQGLLCRFEAQQYRRIYFPAWEGGHPDHDATHLLGLAFCKSGEVTPLARQFYLYNGHGTRWLFFRVMHPISQDLVREIRTIEFKESLKAAFRFVHYRSQVKSWFGLAPQSLFHWLLIRKEILDQVDGSQSQSRPHPGPLLYERWKRMTYEEFTLSSASFRETFL